ncbi:MAG: hypothetical protein U1E31_01180 [Rickettsiales bacterium]
MQTFNNFNKFNNKNNNYFKHITKNIEDLIYLSIFSIKRYSARNINYSNIIIKNLYFLILICLIAPFDIILTLCVLICCCVNLYRLIIIIIGFIFIKDRKIKNKQ